MRYKTVIRLRRFCKALKLRRFYPATLLAIPFQGIGDRQERRMRQGQRYGMSLHGPAGRKYLTSAERRRFLSALKEAPPEARLLCLVLAWSGGRLTEVLALTPAAIDFGCGTANIETLKRRTRGIVRQVPLPRALLTELDRTFRVRELQRDPQLAVRRLWRWSRTTAWRRVKALMRTAGLSGTAATPKGLRHTFGVAAFQANVPPHIVQRWLGHASLRTTAIYGDVSGREERAFAARMWRR
jgi:integrase/recombinase XerD